MKKILSIILSLFISISTLCSIALAEQEELIEGFQESITSIWISNSGIESLKENFVASYSDFIEQKINSIMSAPEYARAKIGLSGNETNQISQIREKYQVDYERGFKVYSTSTNKYLKQYSENSCLEYLLYERPFWAIPYVSQNSFMILDENGNVETEKISQLKQSAIMLSDGFSFLEDYSEIQKLLLQEKETRINDMKIIVIDTFFTFLYIDGNNDDYMIRLYKGQTSDAGWIEELECFKIYTTAEVIQKIINYNNENTNWSLPEDISNEKPTYDTEAEELQEAGFLQGNENGLDLLKPLTRAEAVTLLVRALGLESETVNYTESEFSDIASDNWAAPYAALAKSRGIANGISETEFAPDERVTSDQFAAFALRAIGESDFDYTEGTEILIDKGIITEEQADTMDLFTRGDMAKIIYEMREMGLMRQ